MKRAQSEELGAKFRVRWSNHSCRKFLNSQRAPVLASSAAVPTEWTSWLCPPFPAVQVVIPHLFCRIYCFRGGWPILCSITEQNVLPQPLLHLFPCPGLVFVSYLITIFASPGDWPRLDDPVNLVLMWKCCRGGTTVGRWAGVCFFVHCQHYHLLVAGLLGKMCEKTTQMLEAPGGVWHLAKCLSLKTDKLIKDGIKTGILQCHFRVGGRSRAAL